MVALDHRAPIQFLRTAFELTDWIAIFLKSYERAAVAQRVGSVSWVQSERFQRWLRAMNARRYNVFVSVNAIASGRRSIYADAPTQPLLVRAPNPGGVRAVRRVRNVRSQPTADDVRLQRHIDRREGIHTHRVREVTIRAPEPMLFHVDGEAVQGTDTLVARVRPAALRIQGGNA